LSDYAVQGFPTKIIVNPEGKIANITVGENPAFFDTLAKLINEVK
ncbi:MAG: thiol-disulfide oxidoreductase, partial [Muribaculaceae bacterium]|nr:thiol-disulfide oxidoreductase [Muribaculaceae bacterium]